MTTKPIPVSFKKWIAISAVIGYVALAIYLLFFVGIDSLLSTLGNVNLGIYALAIGSILISVFFHTTVWFELLHYLQINLSFRRIFVLNWVGIFVDNLIPGGWSGDLFKAYLLGRESNVESGKVVASVVAKNMHEAIFVFANMILGIILVLFNYSFEGSILLVVGGFMLLLTLPLIVLMAISFKPKQGKKAVHFVIRGISRLTRNKWKLQRFENQIDELLDDYHEGMLILTKNPRMLVKPMFLSFFAWWFEIFTLYLVFGSLGSAIPLDKIIIVRSIVSNVEGQGYAFAGYAQIMTTALYDQLGIQLGLAASVGLLGGVVMFWLKTIISYVAFHFTVFTSCAPFTGSLPPRIPDNPLNKIQTTKQFSHRNFKSIINKHLPQRIGRGNLENRNNDEEHGSLEFHASKTGTN